MGVVVFQVLILACILCSSQGFIRPLSARSSLNRFAERGYNTQKRSREHFKSSTARYLTPEELAAFTASQNGGVRGIGINLSDLQNAAILLSGVGYVIYERRPKGDSREDLLDVRRSTIGGKNLGVFAKSFIPRGTNLGSYPGFVRSAEDAAARSEFY